MIKKLRIRFVIIMMTLIGLILTGLLVSLITSSRQHMMNDSYRALDELYAEGYTNDGLQIDDNEKSYSEDRFIDDQSKVFSFFTRTSETTELVEITDPSSRVTEEMVYELLISTNNKSENKGILTDYGLIYKKYDNNITGFIDYSHEESFMQRQVRSYFLILGSSLIVFFVASLYLSYIAVKPVERAWKQQQQFIMDASHELKTPLTVIRANTSFLSSNPEEKKQKWVENINSEVKHMQTLIEDLLMLTKLDFSVEQIPFEKVSMSDLAFESTMSFETVFYDAGKELSMDIDSDIYLKGSYSHLKRLNIILLDNAMKYSDKKTITTFSLKKSPSKVILTVNNFGRLIPKEEIDSIFDRFYMVDKSRTRKENSYGLGLTIASEIVKMHEGKITVTSDEENGTTFTVSLNTYDH
ncbi:MULTISPECIES: cell wall metabolism sensor histidine kinase WalK [unclassified Fusibacter]|uniref:sensor histidine kinase n=1 Tax=unclassified Fusibacter TaxID=2624464 RepID=UPI0010100B15|nr:MULTISPECIES: HAMP domain-containing sensor histidine kinase [unclassified Fusibacter]MCK8061635.1 HAMP domain-containing histidine kinase [Fusibacter sp. A2]NPE23819.1 HAMP domain-containing histidine kinase [Fusibacter sp. A1]RXV58593.1 sensor histidine kinase [Fusibacter sp. A1]